MDKKKNKDIKDLCSQEEGLDQSKGVVVTSHVIVQTVSFAKDRLERAQEASVKARHLLMIMVLGSLAGFIFALIFLDPTGLVCVLLGALVYTAWPARALFFAELDLLRAERAVELQTLRDDLSALKKEASDAKEGKILLENQLQRLTAHALNVQQAITTLMDELCALLPFGHTSTEAALRYLVDTARLGIEAESGLILPGGKPPPLTSHSWDTQLNDPNTVAHTVQQTKLLEVAIKLTCNAGNHHTTLFDGPHKFSEEAVAMAISSVRSEDKRELYAYLFLYVYKKDARVAAEEYKQQRHATHKFASLAA